ncbi:hypothetical protein [Mycobacterium colombiense]|uniref:hypothetical protein n=1 Tax=Mycobacterium colombiense TaxID=339268 RepID=UPI0012DB7913|nr:hypothetical protein [Mycobacterium colombiense]
MTTIINEALATEWSTNAVLTPALASQVHPLHLTKHVAEVIRAAKAAYRLNSAHKTLSGPIRHTFARKQPDGHAIGLLFVLKIQSSQTRTSKLFTQSPANGSVQSGRYIEARANSIDRSGRRDCNG